MKGSLEIAVNWCLLKNKLSAYAEGNPHPHLQAKQHLLLLDQSHSPPVTYGFVNCAAKKMKCLVLLSLLLWSAAVQCNSNGQTNSKHTTTRECVLHRWSWLCVGIRSWAASLHSQPAVYIISTLKNVGSPSPVAISQEFLNCLSCQVYLIQHLIMQLIISNGWTSSKSSCCYYAA